MVASDGRREIAVIRGGDGGEKDRSRHGGGVGNVKKWPYGVVSVGVKSRRVFKKNIRVVAHHHTRQSCYSLSHLPEG